MTDATHFIEQYKDKDGDSIMCLVTPINELELQLWSTRYSGYKTVCIFIKKYKSNESLTRKPEPESTVN